MVFTKKQQHADVRREPAMDVSFQPPPIYIGRMLYQTPSTQSQPVHNVQEGFTYAIRRIVGGFDPAETFYEVWAESVEQSTHTALGGPAHFAFGYLLIEQ